MDERLKYFIPTDDRDSLNNFTVEVDVTLEQIKTDIRRKHLIKALRTK